MSDNKNIEKDDENFMFGKNKEIPFIVPSAYFNSLEQRIINRIEAQQELSEFSILSGITKQKEFIIPENYFNNAENKIEYTVELSELHELNKIAKPALNALPVDYAESLKEKVMSKIALQEELKDFATLYSLEKQNAFQVNTDYFDTVADKVKARIYDNGKSKVSVLEQLFLLILKPKYGISFGVLLITGIATAFYFNNKTTALPDGDCKTLACLEKREMLNEHTIREMDDDNLYDMVDVDKLDKQISKGNTADSTSVNNSKK